MTGFNLETRSCACKCGGKFRVLPTSEIRFASKFCQAVAAARAEAARKRRAEAGIKTKPVGRPKGKTKQ